MSAASTDPISGNMRFYLVAPPVELAPSHIANQLKIAKNLSAILTDPVKLGQFYKECGS